MKKKMKPILKWAGGKSFLTPKLKECIKGLNFNRYIEPFFGSGAFYFDMVQTNKRIIKNSIINDSNIDLIQLYKHIKSSPKKLISAHNKIKRQFESKGYYSIREKFNGLDENGKKVKKYSGIERSAALMVLNKTCFNGLYRINKDGKFNVPEGRYKSPSFVQSELIRSVSKVLTPAKNIQAKSYLDIKYRKNDLVYFDPPYHPLSKTSYFTDYSGQFRENEQKELSKKFHELDKKGVHVILSNSKTDFIYNLYKKNKICEVDCARSINAKANKRGRIKEYLILGKNFGK